ncbi:17719_t:CDS:2, partial [Racocetra persica]
RDSTILYDKLQDFCNINRKNYNTLINDVIICWNSTYHMLCRFKDMRDELNLLKIAYCELDNNYPNEAKWESINNIIYLLELILVATEVLSTSSYPTIADVCLTFMEIICHIELFIANKSYSENEHMIARLIKNKLDNYWSILNSDESTKIALILDPTFKLITFQSDIKKKNILTSLQNIIIQYKSSVLATNTASTSTSQAIELPLAEELDITKELNTYLFVSSIDNGSLQWWAANRINFSTLAKMAQDYLAIQETSVPCEKVFSLASETIFKVRNRLKPNTVRASLCLKSWMENNV